MANNVASIQSREINKKILTMILPVTIDNVLQLAAGIVSMGMIGRIDVLAVSALGISARITQIIWALFKGITTGATVYVAQYYGAGNYPQMKKVIQQTLLSVIFLVLVLQVLVYIVTPQFLLIFNPDQQLLSQSVIYMRTVSFGLPFLAVMMVVGGVLQGMGNAATPMLITLFMNVVNIAVGYVLIFGKLGFAPMGIKGAAVATNISQAAAAFIGIYILFRKRGVLHGYSLRDFFRLDREQVSRVYRVGMPTALESIFWQLAAIILTRAILTFGETAFAAHQLGLQAESISYMPAAGFGIAATTFVGQALGTGDKQLAKAYLRQILKGAVFITMFGVIALLAFPRGMMALLTNDAEVIRLGAIYLMLMGLVQLPQNAAGVLSGAMRGAGYTKVPMIVAGVGLWGIRVPLTLIFAYVFKLSIVAIWVAISIDMASRFVICFILFKKNNIYERKLAGIDC